MLRLIASAVAVFALAGCSPSATRPANEAAPLFALAPSALPGGLAEQQRMPGLPASLDGARVLSDLQLVFWPVAALRSELPGGWTLREAGTRRVLSDPRGTVAWVEREAATTRVLHQVRLGYRLRIDSVPLTP